MAVAGIAMARAGALTEIELGHHLITLAQHQVALEIIVSELEPRPCGWRCGHRQTMFQVGQLLQQLPDSGAIGRKSTICFPAAVLMQCHRLFVRAINSHGINTIRLKRQQCNTAL